MASSHQRAVQNYRDRLGKRGLARFEVVGRDLDRDLIRAVARHLAQDSPEAAQLRASLSVSVAGPGASKGGILAALRRSPLVGADLDLTRSHEGGRDVGI